MLGEEGDRARRQLVKNDANRPNISPRVDHLAVADLFGRHVRRRAHHALSNSEARRFHFHAASDFGDAEVEHFDKGVAANVLRNEQVSRLEIAVNNTERMSLADGFARFDDVPTSFLDRQRTTGFEHVVEVHSLEVLHHDVRDAIGHARDVVNLDGVRTFQARCSPRFTQETFDGIGR